MKKVYIRDLNMPSGLGRFYLDLEQKGISVINVDELSYIKDDAVIINPINAMQSPWQKINDYFKANEDKKVFLFTSDLLIEEAEKLLGKHSNLRYSVTRIDWARGRMGDNLLKLEKELTA
jgi:hypothetical protein